VKILSAEFVLSASRAIECPKGPRLEIAVSGRSNVGKSSMLNSVLGRRKLAKVSDTTGKTQLLNYFLINDRFHLVDLPGYGYAKAPESLRDQWRSMMQGYLRTRRQLVGMIQLVDSRHEPSREDREMVKWLMIEQLPFCLIASKIDKLSSTKRAPALRMITRELGVPATQVIVPYSSETGEGRSELLAWMDQTLTAASSA
jgi:GTP-binding protein